MMKQRRKAARVLLTASAAITAGISTLPSAAADDDTTLTESGIGAIGSTIADTVDLLDPSTEDLDSDEPVGQLEGDGADFTTWGTGVNVRSEPTTESDIVTTLPGPTAVDVACQTQGELVEESGHTNDWWSYVPDLGGYVTNIYLDTPESMLPGVEECGVEIQPLEFDAPNSGGSTGDGEYVALGDSAAAGVGAGEYDTISGDCHQSYLSYPRLVASRLGASLTFQACYGATVDKVINGDPSKGSPSQLEALDEATTWVTVQVGVNDAGFQRVLTTCGVPDSPEDPDSLMPQQGPCEHAVEEARTRIRDELAGSLGTLYQQIRERAPTADVVVVGYPEVFPGDGDDCSDWDYWYATWFSFVDQQLLNDTAELLNTTTRATAERYGFAFVDPTDTFRGHEVCQDDPWIHVFKGLRSENPDTWWEAYHPTREGHEAYADLVEDDLAN